MNKETAVFTLSEVAQHKSQKDCWIIINGKVLDVTKFLEEHPGGHEVLMEVAGKDATEDFEDIGHSNDARESLLKYQIGSLQGLNIQNDDDDSKVGVTNSLKQSKQKEIKAFVVKDKPVPKYAAFAQFFVPLLVAGIFLFGYRYLTRAG